MDHSHPDTSIINHSRSLLRLSVLPDHLYLCLGDVPLHVLRVLLAGGAPGHEPHGQHGDVAADPGHGDRGQRGQRPREREWRHQDAGHYSLVTACDNVMMSLTWHVTLNIATILREK